MHSDIFRINNYGVRFCQWRRVGRGFAAFPTAEAHPSFSLGTLFRIFSPPKLHAAVAARTHTQNSEKCDIRSP